MADWETIDMDKYTDTETQNSYIYTNGQHSRESSLISETETSSSNKENQQTADRQTSVLSDNSTLSNSSQRELILDQGIQLKEESRTESTYYNNKDVPILSAMTMDDIKVSVPPPDKQPTDSDSAPKGDTASRHPSIPPKSWSGGTAKEKTAKSPYAPANIETIPQEDFTIPKDANISSFSANQLANFLRCLRVDDRIISHLHRKSVDGKRFSRLSDSELENLNMKNPVVEYFRERSNVKAGKKKGPFML